MKKEEKGNGKVKEEGNKEDGKEEEYVQACRRVLRRCGDRGLFFRPGELIW